jgi:predicted RNA-binding Zn-ribbon protein involved in translation (DUF1610 family)
MVELEEEWEETSFHCPECGSALSYKLVKGQNGTVNMAFWCEGAGDDLFTFEIATGLTNMNLQRLKKGKPIKKEATVTVWERKSEE